MRRVSISPLSAARAVAYIPLGSMLVAALVGLISILRGSPTTSAAAPSPPASIGAAPLTPTANSLRPGTAVRETRLGRRVFADARHGFALASVGQGQYPAASGNGGASWRIDGPVLHVSAAQTPPVALHVGVVNRRTYFAWGGPGGGQVVDVTSDGGGRWWRAVLGEVVLAVRAGEGGRLFAVTQVAGAGGSAPARTCVYASRDGGRHWRYDGKLGAI
jgi:hypothetical protein